MILEMFNIIHSMTINKNNHILNDMVIFFITSRSIKFIIFNIINSS